MEFPAAAPAFLQANGGTSPNEILRKVCHTAFSFPTFSDSSSTSEDDLEMEEEVAAATYLQTPSTTTTPQDSRSLFDFSFSPFTFGSEFSAKLYNSFDEMVKGALEMNELRLEVVNQMKKEEIDCYADSTSKSKSYKAENADTIKVKKANVTSAGMEKWYNLPKKFEGTVTGQRYNDLQNRVMPLLILQMRRHNRNLCECLDEVDEAVSLHKQALRSTMNELTDIQYELAWLKRRIYEENSFSTPVWDSLREVMISEKVYIQDSVGELTFVREEEDAHQFTLNWMNYDLQERIKGKEHLDSIKRERETAEQRLQALQLKEAEIPKKLLAIEKAVEDVYNICSTNMEECVEFPDEARNLPGPLLNLFSRLFVYRHIMSDTKLEVGMEVGPKSAVLDASSKEVVHDLYEPHSQQVSLSLQLEEETPLPETPLLDLLITLPFRITFQYIPSLDVVTVSTNITEKLGAQENLTVLSSLLERDADDLGIFSPNPSNYNSDLADGVFENQRSRGARPYRWAQTLAGMKYGITLPYVKPLPEEINVGELLKRIRNRVAFRIWTIYQNEYLRSKPMEVIPVRQSSLLPSLPNSISTIISYTKASVDEYRQAATLQSWPEDTDAEDLLCGKAIIQHSDTTITAYVAIPLNENYARFRFVQMTGAEKIIDERKELSEYERQLYRGGQSQQSLLRASNTIVKNETLTHYQHSALLDLEDFVNSQVVEQYGGVDGNYRFTMFSIQIASMKVGIDRYMKENSRNLEYEKSIALKCNNLTDNGEQPSQTAEVEDVEMT